MSNLPDNFNGDAFDRHYRDGAYAPDIREEEALADIFTISAAYRDAINALAATLHTHSFSITVDSFVSTALGLYDGLRIDADEAYTALEDNNVSPDFTQDEAKEFARQAYIRMFKGEEAHKAYVKQMLAAKLAEQEAFDRKRNELKETLRLERIDRDAALTNAFRAYEQRLIAKQGESHA